MYGLLGSDIWPRNNYLKIWNTGMPKKNLNIEKNAFKCSHNYVLSKASYLTKMKF